MIEKEANKQNEGVLDIAEIESKQVNGYFRFFEATQ
jgi:hypothetical protein